MSQGIDTIEHLDPPSYINRFSFVQVLATTSLIIKSILLLLLVSLLLISVLNQILRSLSFEFLGSILVAMVLTPIAFISLIADSLYFLKKDYKHKSILIIVSSTFWVIGPITLVFELIILGFLFTAIATQSNSNVALYLLVANHLFMAPFLLSSLILAPIVWNLISKQQPHDIVVSDVTWPIGDVISYTPQY